MRTVSAGAEVLGSRLHGIFNRGLLDIEPRVKRAYKVLKEPYNMSKEPYKVSKEPYNVQSVKRAL